MAKRYTISKTVTLQQTNDANTLVFDEQIDLAIELSQRLQRNVRQGHVFKVHKLALGLTPAGGDLDTGMATAGTIRWAPATKNSVKAWQMAFNTWRKQKALKVNAVGQGVRYDDFEIAFSDPYMTSRTSSLRTTGLEDNNGEQVTIYGASTSGVDVSLEDIYESAQPQLLPSRFPIGNTVVKESKFTQEFPAANVHNFGANWSTIIADDIQAPDSGAAYNADPVYFEDKNSLCGVLVVKGYCLAEDVAGAVEDSLTLQLNITCEISTPLVYKPKRRKSKSTKASKPRRMTYRRRGKK